MVMLFRVADDDGGRRGHYQPVRVNAAAPSMGRAPVQG
jgi:hypothetical protein